MLNRIKALATVGRFLGTEEMKKQIKQEEKKDLYRFTHRYYMNKHGVSQQAEMKACEYMQEGAEIGWEYIKEIHEYCR